MAGFVNSSVAIHGVARIEVEPRYFPNGSAGPFHSLKIRAFDAEGREFNIDLFAADRANPVPVAFTDSKEG